MSKLSTFVTLLTLLQQSACLALPPVKSSGSVITPRGAHSQAGLLKIPVSKSTENFSVQKRQDSATLYNEGPFYFIDISLGTPTQSTRVTIDTGSSDLWVDPECSTSAASSFCSSISTYNASKSSTETNLDKTFSLAYGGGSASGEWYTDLLSFGSASSFKQQFGVATSSSGLYTGLMGISFGYGYNTNYNNVIDTLAANGVINSKAFSLDLGSASTSEGSIIFGGIDTMKFSGTLTKNSIVPAASSPDGTARYWVALTGYGQTRAATGSTTLSSSGYSQDVVLDSGTTFCYLPSATVSSMIAGTGMTYTSVGNGKYTVSCNYASDSTSTVDFTFGSVTIKVPYSSFIYNSGGTCYFGAIGSSSGDSILGDTFLRAAYGVFDQSNMNIWLAQGANCGTNLVAIGKGASAVTSMVGGCAGATSTAVSSSTKTTSSSTSTKPSTTSTSSKATSSPATTLVSTTKATSCQPSTTTSTLPAVTQTTTVYGFFPPSGANKSATTFRSTSSKVATMTTTKMAGCTAVTVVEPAVTVVVTTTRYLL